jgi:hypothetical protein
VQLPKNQKQHITWKSNIRSFNFFFKILKTRKKG